MKTEVETGSLGTTDEAFCVAHAYLNSYLLLQSRFVKLIDE